MTLSSLDRGHLAQLPEDFEVVALAPFTRRTISSELAEFIAQHARGARRHGEWSDHDYATPGTNPGDAPAGAHSWDYSQAPA